jgi:hypothetical protein
MNEFIKWVCLLNFGELDTYPQFQLWNDEQVDKTLAERDGILSRDCKVTFTPEYYVKAYGFVPEDIAKIGDDQSKPPVQFSEPQNPKSFAGQTAIDQYADTLSVQELQKQADGILKPVIDMINECNDFGECLDKLAKTFPSMDSLALQEMLSRAIFVSEYIGNAEAARE